MKIYLLLTVVSAFVALSSEAESSNELVFGMSTALTGPAADLGLNMRSGVLAAFNAQNEIGGVANKKLSLTAYDDGYEPTLTVPNMQQLILKDRVLAIIGNVGTPTAVAAIPVAVENKTLFFAAYTGAGVLRKTPPERYVINYRASYAQEAATMIDGLLSHGIKIDEIAFFTQRDSYGDAGFSGGIEALKKHGLNDSSQVVHVRYERNTLGVENALADIFGAAIVPKAIIMVGAYAPCAKFIKLAKQNGLKAIFLNVSFVGSESLARELGAEGEGVIVTQVVPPIIDDRLPVVKDFKRDFAKYSADRSFTFGAFEGYIAAKILIKSLENISGEINREKIIDSLQALESFSIGMDNPLLLSKNSHQASNFVWLTSLHKGIFVEASWQEVMKGFK